MYSSIIFWLGHLSDQTGICTGQHQMSDCYFMFCIYMSELLYYMGNAYRSEVIVLFKVIVLFIV